MVGRELAPSAPASMAAAAPMAAAVPTCCTLRLNATCARNPMHTGWMDIGHFGPHECRQRSEAWTRSHQCTAYSRTVARKCNIQSNYHPSREPSTPHTYLQPAEANCPRRPEPSGLCRKYLASTWRP